jgi:hypothetical protein
VNLSVDADTQRAVQLLAAINFLVIGLSHVFQPRGWAEFFIWLRSKGQAGVFVNGFISLTFGSLVVAFHHVWSGLPIVLTIFGWAQVLKALVSFTAPSVGMKSLERVSVERSHEFIGAGAVLLVLSGLMWYLVLTG